MAPLQPLDPNASPQRLMVDVLGGEDGKVDAKAFGQARSLLPPSEETQRLMSLPDNTIDLTTSTSNPIRVPTLEPQAQATGPSNWHAPPGPMSGPRSLPSGNAAELLGSSTAIAREISLAGTNLAVVAQSRKRARGEDDETLQPEDITLPGEEEGDIVYTWTCSQIRNKIERLLRSSEMKVTAFQKQLDINSNSYGRFMKLKGDWNGIDNQTFEAAYLFFKKREIAGIKEPVRPKTMTQEETEHLDVSGITIEGEETDTIPIYDTCDEILNKINAHLRNTATTTTAFLKTIAAMYKTRGPNLTIQSKQLRDFLGYKGPTSGNSNVVYYGAYVFHEKLRLKHGGAKTKKRKENEVVHARERGFSREQVRTGGLFLTRRGVGRPRGRRRRVIVPR